ncbi:MAG: cache domain-containing protein [Thiomargarita sp.]|nr:cache domain-containing protein [Thiomargarita sp.]
MLKINSLRKINFIGSIIAIVLSAFSLGAYSIYDIFQHYKKESHAFEERYIQSQKNILSTYVNQTIEHIIYHQAHAEEWLKKDIKERVYAGYEIAMSIYNRYHKTKTIEEIRELLHDILYSIRWKGEKGYFFALDMEGMAHIHKSPRIEYKNMIHLQDSFGNFFIQEFIHIAKTQGEGYLKYSWKKPYLSPKYSFIKYFEPLDWLIGASEYLENVEQELQKEVIKWIAEMKYEKDGYIFIIDRIGNVLFHPDKSLIGKNMMELTDPNGVEITKALIRASQLEEGGFVNYLWVKPSTSELTEKLSYARYLPKWEWIICAGVYLDEKEEVLSKKSQELKAEVQKHLILIIIIFLCIACFAFLISYFFSKRITCELERFAIFLRRSTTNYQLLDKNQFQILELISLAETANNVIIKRKRAEDKSMNLAYEDKLKDEFLANTSHELRTPLNGIIGIAESLIDGASGQLSNLTKANLAMIVGSGKRLAILVNDILDFSKLKHNLLELHLKPVAIKEIIDVVLMSCSPLVDKKNVQLINAVPDNLPPALADENRLQQILHNLLGNAIKFTESGSVKVSVDVLDIEESSRDKLRNGNSISSETKRFLKNSRFSSFLSITISDTGIGFSAERQNRIFQYFEQADGSIAREYGGTGLGLALTKQLVQLHSGKIFAKSTLGEGSQFTFTLPITEEEVEKSQVAKKQKISDSEKLVLNLNFDESPCFVNDLRASASEGIFNIFVVDDDRVNLQVFTNYLLLNNYAVVQAKNGLEALDKIETGYLPDLILLDVMMPKMTGYEFCQKIRKRYSANELPILMLTAKNQVSDIVTGLEVGANDFLTKPIFKEELLARVKTHLELSKINIAYSYFVPHQFLQILNKKSIIELQLGEQVQREMTILFSDIRGFTSLSEKMTPQDNFDFINSYLSQMEPVISQHHGFIDKYIGDGIMALFPTGADDAVRSAIAMLEKLVEYNQGRKRAGYSPISIGIGLNTGELMLGTIGGKNRMDGTVISDAVNVASRIEGLTKVYGSAMLITEYTYAKLADPSQYHIRMIDTVKVKGKSEKITIYEVFDADKAECILLKNQTRSDFKAGFMLYHDEQFNEARSFFEKVLQANSNDKVALLYLEHCLKILSMTIPKKPEILIVDDIPFNLKLLSDVLTSNNYKVMVATNGKTALKIAALKRPHLILLDVIMPEMDGFEICQQLKANPKTRNIPIIFISTILETVNKVKGFELGAVDHITKPFQLKELLVRVKTHLHLNHLQRRASWNIKKMGGIEFSGDFEQDFSLKFFEEKL